jgi:hypothetical protein
MGVDHIDLPDDVHGCDAIASIGYPDFEATLRAVMAGSRVVC